MSAAQGSILDRIDLDAYVAEAAESPRGVWAKMARPNQLPPEGWWKVWLILAGRGWGKTRSGAECIASLARKYPGARIALVARTFADARDVMVEGVSGLLSVFDASELKGGSQDLAWNRSIGELFLANGTRFKVYSSERPAALRGPGNHFAWGDEAAFWLDAAAGTSKDTTWSNLRINVRERALPGWPDDYRTRIVVTTTPKTVALLKVADSVVAREPSRAGIMQLDGTVLTRGKTKDNLQNLDEGVAAMVAQFDGTTTGRQEFDGEMLEDNDDAFLPRSLLERCHVTPGDVFEKVLSGVRVVGVDPAVTEGEHSDLTGISVISRGDDGNVYVLADHSVKASPTRWALTVWHAVFTYRAQVVVVEDNQGGDMVEHTLRVAWPQFVEAWRTNRGKAMISAIDPDTSIAMPANDLHVVPIKRVHPAGPNSGKWVRAQPLRLLYEQGRVRHVLRPAEPAHFFDLEDQLSTWTGSKGEKSPDRIDALVHAVDFVKLPAERARDRYMQPGGQRQIRTGARMR